MKVTVGFEMTNGSILECVYHYQVYRGVHTMSNGDPGYPDDFDVSEPEYFLDGKEVDTDELPKGLDAIADKMFCDVDSSTKGFTYVQQDERYAD